MEKKLILIGGGGHCKSVLDTALNCNEYSEIVITDPTIPAGTDIYGCVVKGNDDYLPQLYAQGFHYAFVTVGSITDAKLRIRLSLIAKKIGFSFPSIIDPSARVSENALIGEGTFVGKKAVINADAVVGNCCIINTGSIIEHECHIGDYSHISVGAILCGNVKIGKECFIGAGVTVIQGITIGGNTIVGAGSLVNRDLPESCLAIGLPARVKR